MMRGTALRAIWHHLPAFPTLTLSLEAWNPDLFLPNHVFVQVQIYSFPTPLLHQGGSSIILAVVPYSCMYKIRVITYQSQLNEGIFLAVDRIVAISSYHAVVNKAKNIFPACVANSHDGTERGLRQKRNSRFWKGCIGATARTQGLYSRFFSATAAKGDFGLPVADTILWMARVEELCLASRVSTVKKFSLSV